MGYLAPPFSTATLDGTVLLSESLRGTVVVINFWATRCGPCRVEMPELERYSREMAGAVTIVGVNMQEPPADVAPFVARTKVSFPIVLDSGSMSAPDRVAVLPTTIILDRAGMVRARASGPMNRDLLARRVGPLL